MTEISCIKCPFCGKSTPTNIATFKSGDPPNLAEISIRYCQGRKGFPLVGRSTLRDEINTDVGLKLINELVDMAGGILWLCWEENLYDRVHPPLLINRYGSLLSKLKDCRKLEDVLRLQAEGFRQDVLKLVEALKVEKARFETIAFDHEDAQNKILQLQSVVDKYEVAALH